MQAGNSSSPTTLGDHFTSRRCGRGLSELPGSFSKSGACASNGLFTCVSICPLSFFLNHLLKLLTLNPSISITFIMERASSHQKFAISAINRSFGNCPDPLRQILEKLDGRYALQHGVADPGGYLHRRGGAGFSTCTPLRLKLSSALYGLQPARPR